ncbi:hypothetical protein DL769_005762 [Monosporascus sp. CRB-8-3]|nr:hypothetical protein DL769_005762 [Monosporascus sp. CRB-8-3]
MGNGHNSVKEDEWRKLGKLPELPPVHNKRRALPEDDKDIPMETTCINCQESGGDDVRFTMKRCMVRPF